MLMSSDTKMETLCYRKRLRQKLLNFFWIICPIQRIIIMSLSFFFFLVYIMSLSLGYGNWFSLIMNGHVLRSFCIPVTTVVRPCSLPLARDPNLKLMSLKRT